MKKNTILIIFVTIIIIVIIVIYWFILNQNLFKINKLKKENKVLSITDPNNIVNKYLDYPLYKFYISTSHNTYLNGSQHLSIVTGRGIIDALNLNARAIELDLHLIGGNVVVAHGNEKILTTSYITLEYALDIINEHAFKNTIDPLIINIEIPDKNNIEFVKKIKEIFLKSKIKDYLYLPDYNYANGFKSYVNNDFALTPIRNLIHKIVLIGDTDDYNILNDIINVSFNYKNIDETHRYITQKRKEDNIISRVYKSGDIYSALSLNLNALEFFKNYHNMVALNFQMYDKYLYEYLDFFKNSSFVLIE
jgi:hypothetical protein